MLLKLIDGFIIADGNPMELAMYTHTLLEIFKLKHDIDEEEQDDDFISRLKDISFSELISREMKDDNEEENND